MMETLTANQNTTVNYRAVSSNNVSNSTILLKRRLGCKSDLKEDILPERQSYDLQDNWWWQQLGKQAAGISSAFICFISVSVFTGQSRHAGCCSLTYFNCDTLSKKRCKQPVESYGRHNSVSLPFQCVYVWNMSQTWRERKSRCLVWTQKHKWAAAAQQFTLWLF